MVRLGSVLFSAAQSDRYFIFVLKVGMGAASGLVLGEKTAHFLEGCDCLVAILSLLLGVTHLKHGCGRPAFVAPCYLVVKRDCFIMLFQTPVAGCHLPVAFRESL